MTSTNIARILNIYPRKGAIAVGSDADIVVWDPKATQDDHAPRRSQSIIDYNVFEGFQCTRPADDHRARADRDGRKAIMRAEAGDGQYVERDPFPAAAVANATWHELNVPKPVERLEVTP